MRTHLHGNRLTPLQGHGKKDQGGVHEAVSGDGGRNTDDFQWGGEKWLPTDDFASCLLDLLIQALEHSVR